MENELMNLNMDQIVIKQGSVEFKEYDNLKHRALDLATNIEMIELTDENIKTSKKLLAAVNKRLKELEDRRIKIKKLMLEPYVLFESQVKEIVGIVKEADETLRQQVREVEEQERQSKRNQLKEIFDKRKEMYTLKEWVQFEDFEQPQHLNKTQSIQATEKEMIEFLERTEKDVTVLKRLPDKDLFNDHINAYLKSFDLALAMTQVQNEKERREAIGASKLIQENQQTNFMKTITLYDEKDFLLVEMYMNNNHIKFTSKDGI